MEDIDIEQQEPFPVDRDGRQLRRRLDQPDGNGKGGCCDKFQESVSKWMLPEDARSKYLERANCCPPPIFIILISIAERFKLLKKIKFGADGRRVDNKLLLLNAWREFLRRATSWPPPFFIILVTLAELAVFIYYAVWKPQKQWVTLENGIWNSPLTYQPDHREEAWRFLSYMFVHAGVEHIVGNLVMQLILGIPLELVHKGFEVGMVYMAGVLAGSLCSSIFDPHSALVGASGGVYALIGGYFMNAVVNFREMIPLLGVFRILTIVVFVAVDFGFAFYRRFVSDEAGFKVSFVAHFGGIVAGMTIGYVFFSAYNQKLLKDPRFWLCIVGYIVFLIVAVIFNVFLTPV